MTDKSTDRPADEPTDEPTDSPKSKPPKRLKLASQVLVSMAIVFCLVLFSVARFVEISENERLTNDLENRVEIIASLVGGLIIEAIIVEDSPVIETALAEARKRLPSIVSILVENAQGTVLAINQAQFEDVAGGAQEARSQVSEFEEVLTFEGTTFGTLRIQWSMMQGYRLIDTQVRRFSVYTALTMGFLTVLFMVITSVLVLRPLRRVHGRMQNTLERKEGSQAQIWAGTASEFWTLSQSVDLLEKTLTERDQREIDLTRARKKADQANQAKSEFLANMSHEIRTPMNGVIGMAQLMLDTPMSDDQTMYVNTIHQSGVALVDIINDILDYSKIEAGKMTLAHEPFCLRNSLEDIVTLMATQACGKGIEVMLDYPTDLPLNFVGDSGRTRQIVMNVFGNAVKFTETGYVEIQVRGQTSGENCCLTISVKDTGIGIPEEKLASVFGAFEQADGASTRKFEGTGLGLSISNRLVQQMGGTIEVSSVLGTGSTFTIQISLPISADTACEPESEAFAVEFQGKTVLVVDDLHVNRLILKDLLTSWGFDVLLAESAHQALNVLEHQHAQNKKIDVAVLDYQMPVHTGFYLAEEIVKSTVFENLPLVLCSSVDTAFDAGHKAHTIFSQIIQKPLRFETLRKALFRAMSATPNANSLKGDSHYKSPGKEATVNKPHAEPNQDQSLRTEKIGCQIPKILVAEDNKTNQLVLRAMLKNLRVELKFSGNGLEACEQYERFAPDFIFMDLSMPIMGGLEATREIRAIEKRANLDACPIFALTANVMESDRKACDAAGMNGFLSKPINKKDLMAQLHKWCAISVLA